MFCLRTIIYRSVSSISDVGIDLSRCVSWRWIMCGWCFSILVLSSFLLASLLRLRQFIVRIVSRFWLSRVELIDVLLPVDMLEVFMSSTWLFIIGVGWHVWPLCNVWFIVSFCLHFGHDHIMLSHLHILLYSTGLMLPHLMWNQCSQLSHDIALWFLLTGLPHIPHGYRIGLGFGWISFASIKVRSTNVLNNFGNLFLSIC